MKKSSSTLIFLLWRKIFSALTKSTRITTIKNPNRLIPLARKNLLQRSKASRTFNLILLEITWNPIWIMICPQWSRIFWGWYWSIWTKFRSNLCWLGRISIKNSVASLNLRSRNTILLNRRIQINAGMAQRWCACQPHSIDWNSRTH